MESVVNTGTSSTDGVWIDPDIGAYAICSNTGFFQSLPAPPPEPKPQPQQLSICASGTGGFYIRSKMTDDSLSSEFSSGWTGNFDAPATLKFFANDQLLRYIIVNDDLELYDKNGSMISQASIAVPSTSFQLSIIYNQSDITVTIDSNSVTLTDSDASVWTSINIIGFSSTDSAASVGFVANKLTASVVAQWTYGGTVIGIGENAPTIEINNTDNLLTVKTNDVSVNLEIYSLLTASISNKYVPIVNGGLAPYSYLWKNSTSIVSQDQNFTPEPGSYTLTVTDFSGQKMSVNFEVHSLIVSAKINDAVCEGPGPFQADSAELSANLEGQWNSDIAVEVVDVTTYTFQAVDGRTASIILYPVLTNKLIVNGIKATDVMTLLPGHIAVTNRTNMAVVSTEWTHQNFDLESEEVEVRCEVKDEYGNTAVATTKIKPLLMIFSTPGTLENQAGALVFGARSVTVNVRGTDEDYIWKSGGVVVGTGNSLVVRNFPVTLVVSCGSLVKRYVVKQWNGIYPNRPIMLTTPATYWIKNGLLTSVQSPGAIKILVWPDGNFYIPTQKHDENTYALVLGICLLVIVLIVIVKFLK